MIKCQYCLHENEHAFKGKCDKCSDDPMAYLYKLILEDLNFMNCSEIDPKELIRAVRELDHEYMSLQQQKRNLQEEIKKLRQRLKEAKNGRPNIGL